MIKTSITDSPRNVIEGEKDNFGIEPFENGLTKFINNSNTPITIALQGEWGSGKTSLMNSLKKNLSDIENSKYHSIWLNTWEYALMKDASTTLIDIITKLIQEVSDKTGLEKTQKDRLINGVRKIGLSALRIGGAFHSIGNKVADEIENNINKDTEVTIGEIRDELEDIIEKYINDKENNKTGFIFFIDDLDRIDPPIAVQLLELLKNIFTLKKCVFVLAIDYDVVIKGLEPKFGKLSEKNEREFRSFFDKIIQVPFSMPVSNYNIDDFLKDSLVSTNYINETHLKNKELITKFSEISNLSVGKNPRALKRLMNSLSLISCINSAKGNDRESDPLNEELELLVNFALVSIQIAYPPVYRLLSLHSGYDKWDESVALQMNLEPLDKQSIDKLNSLPEFDEPWEQILFRLCENDHYLKKRALNISRLLNSLKITIEEKEEEVEDIIGAVISLSSVTNLEAFDKPVADYHRGNFLKHLRMLLIPELKKNLPEITNFIKADSKNVRSNATIIFAENNWQVNEELRSEPITGGVRLRIRSTRYMCALMFNNLSECINNAGLEVEFTELEKEYESFEKRHSNIIPSKFYEPISKADNSYILYVDTYFILPTVGDFSLDENIKEISKIISEKYYILLKLETLAEKLSAFINPLYNK